MKKGTRTHGYSVERVENLKGLDSTLIQLRHNVTGTKHIHIKNRDKENTFAILFRTVPEDSTGVAHILEHTVLCGSKKFNVKDPFFSMLKRGLSTFMNAFTSSDWTMYPFSTQNFKDYYNIADVYLDATFFPKLDELSFKQEGHRIELVNNGKYEELAYKGVVYNEMKGAMSSPSEILRRSLLKVLCPETTYSNNSGGDPTDIPELSLEGLKAFHSKYYHPSNSFFYTYGSFDLEGHLKFISEKVLSKFSKKEMDTTIASQSRWEKPKRTTYYYPLSKEEKPDKKFQACVAWLTADIKDFFEIIVLIVLEQILLGNAASPLKKALIDSGLGSDLCDGTGFDSEMRDTVFACGLKDITKDSIKDVEKLIFKTLRDLVKKGIDKKLIDSAIHQIEFSRKEKTNSPYPFGIKLFLTFAGTWIHQGDVVNCIELDKDLEKFKELTNKGGFLEKKIEQYFINNPHRVLFTLAPDQDMEQKEVDRIKQKLALILKKLRKEKTSKSKPSALEKIINDAKKLALLQNKDEDLSSLPCLELSDVPPDVEKIVPSNIAKVTGLTCYEKPTSGILYFTCPVGIGNVKKELTPFIPFFSRAFINSGTEQRNYAEMAELIDLYTGGISLSHFIGTKFSNNLEHLSFVSLQGKSLDRNVENLFDILQEFIQKAAFSDFERIKQLLYQSKAQFESSIVRNGHIYALSLASRNLTYSSGLSEIWSGITQYIFLKNLIKKIEKKDYDFLRLASDLREISKSVFQQNNIIPAAIGGKDSIIKADKKLKNINNILKKNTGNAFKSIDIAMDTSLPHEGWSTNTSVAFTAQSFKTVRIVHEDSASLSLISRLLRSLYIHREIREKGGAYGGLVMYNSENGIFSFASYRDPNINRTIDIYQQACDFIRQADSYSDDDIKEAVLQVCADIDRPETPGPASINAYYRSIVGLSDEIRTDFKQKLLTITRNKIKDVADKYFDTTFTKEKGTIVIASKEMLENANKELKEKKQLLKIKKI